MRAWVFTRVGNATPAGTQRLSLGGMSVQGDASTVLHSHVAVQGLHGIIGKLTVDISGTSHQAATFNLIKSTSGVSETTTVDQTVSVPASTSGRFQSAAPTLTFTTDAWSLTRYAAASATLGQVVAVGFSYDNTVSTVAQYPLAVAPNGGFTLSSTPAGYSLPWPSALGSGDYQRNSFFAASDVPVRRYQHHISVAPTTSTTYRGRVRATMAAAPTNGVAIGNVLTTGRFTSSAGATYLTIPAGGFADAEVVGAGTGQTVSMLQAIAYDTVNARQIISVSGYISSTLANVFGIPGHYPDSSLNTSMIPKPTHPVRVNKLAVYIAASAGAGNIELWKNAAVYASAAVPSGATGVFTVTPGTPADITTADTFHGKAAQTSGTGWDVRGFSFETVPLDDTVDAFTFTDRTATLNTQAESNTITVSGLGTGQKAFVSLTSGTGEFRINGGAWQGTSAVGEVGNGDTVQLRQLSSSTEGTATNLTVAIGGVSDTWTVTAQSVFNTPTDFFTGGFVGAFYDVQDPASMFQDTAGTVAAAVGQPVARILDKSGNGKHINQATASARPILRLSGGFYHLEFDGVDDHLAFMNTMGITTSSMTGLFVGSMNSATPAYGRMLSFQQDTSNEDWSNVQSAVLSRENANQQVEVYRNGGRIIVPITYDTFHVIGTIYNGPSSTSRLRVDASTNPAISYVGQNFNINSFYIGRAKQGDHAKINVRAALVINRALSDTDWENFRTWAATAPVDTTPDAFTFTDVTGAERTTSYISNSITVSGISSGGAPISVTNGSYSINGGPFVSTSGTVYSGQTVRVLHTSAGTYGTTTSSVLTIGGVSDTYSVTTKEQRTGTVTRTLAPLTLGGGTAPRPWTPADLPGNKGWYKFDELSGANGSAVGTVPEASGRGTAFNATPTNGPTLVAAGLNGKNVISFAAPSQQYLTIGTTPVAGATEGTVLFLAKATRYPNVADNTAGPLIGFNPGQTNVANHDSWSDGLVYEDFMSTTRRDGMNPVVDRSLWGITAMRSKPAAWQYLTNGINRSGVITPNTVDAPASGPGYLGKAHEFATFYGGHVAEVLFVATYLADADMQRVEGYLAHKWGVTSILDAAHPYKTSAPTVAGSAATGVLSQGKVSGSLAKTLAPLTSGGAGKLAVRGSTTRTLGALTGTGTGKVAVRGATTRTLAALTSAGSGRVAVRGATTRTLQALSGNSVARLRVAGAASRTLGALTGTSAARVAIRATSTRTLAALTSTGAGKAAIRGTATRTLAALTSGGVGKLALRGSVTRTFAPLTGTAAGATAIRGLTARTLAPLTGTSAARLAVAGSTAATLAPLSSIASGYLQQANSLNVTLAPLSATATGALPIRAATSRTLASLTGTGAGALSIRAAVTRTLGALTATGAGVLPIRGVASRTFAPLSGNAIGALPLRGSVTRTFAPLTGTTAGALSIRGTATRTFAPLAATGAGRLPLRGSATRTFAPLTATSVARVEIRGIASRTFAPLTGTAAAGLSIRGAATRTFAPLVGVGTARLPIFATTARTLAALTSTGGGHLPIRGTASKTFAPLTSTAAAGLRIRATGGGTFAPLGFTGSGVLRLTGASTSTFAPVSGTGTARLPIRAGVNVGFASLWGIARGQIIERVPAARVAEASGTEADGRLADALASERIGRLADASGLEFSGRTAVANGASASGRMAVVQQSRSADRTAEI